jgi:hypothetical protein
MTNYMGDREDIAAITTPLLGCDFSAYVGLAGPDGLQGDEHWEDCQNEASGMILMIDPDDEYQDMVTLKNEHHYFHCDDHAAEMLHEVRQELGSESALYTMQFASVQQVV